MKKRTVMKIIKWVVFLLIIGGVAFFVYGYMQQQNLRNALSEIPSYSYNQAVMGDIDVGVTAKGSVSSHYTGNVVLDWTGKVKAVNYEVGDIVQEGDVLAVVENDNLSSDIAAANNSLKQQEIALQKQVDSLSKTIVAPSAGRIKKIEAKIGEDASTTTGTYGQVCWISPDGKMELTCVTDYAVQVEQPLFIRDSRDILYTARVTSVQGTTTTMEIIGDETLNIGDHVKVFLPDDDLIFGEGDVTIKNGIKVTGSGKVSQIHVKNGDMVSRGDLLFTLDTSDALLSYESQTISVAEAQRKIADLRKDQGKSELLSPYSGVITELSLLEGQNASSGMTVAKVRDIENLETVINVDELDITKVEVGQTVNLTFEAIEGKTFTGTVSKIAVIGNVTNNYATYPVTISIDNPGEIKIGMSCEATILIDSVDNVLMLPVEMLQRGRDGYSVLLVTGGLDPDAASEKLAEPQESTGGGMNNRMAAMQGAMMGNGQPTVDPLSVGVQVEQRAVTVGLINEDYAQILSGLEEGDWVAIVNANSMSMMDMMMGGGAVRTEAVYVTEGGPSGAAPRGE